MSTTGSYYITDETTGRKFLIEPIGRSQEKVFTNGGVGGDAEKNKSTPQGGSISNKDSQITEDGFKDIVFIGPHMSPDNYISHICKNNLRLNDPEEIKKGFARLTEEK